MTPRKPASRKKPDREGGEDDVCADREGELDAREQEGVETEHGEPRKTVICDRAYCRFG
jgi:hypothetical protein